MKILTVDNIVCKIGENKVENWFLLTKSRNYFFHLSSFPSCFVVLETDTPTNQQIIECCRLCKSHTKYDFPLYVDCTQLYNVNRGENVGEIYYSNAKKVKKIKV